MSFLSPAEFRNGSTDFGKRFYQWLIQYLLSLSMEILQKFKKKKNTLRDELLMNIILGGKG